jgi:predicted dehydrogenase
MDKVKVGVIGTSWWTNMVHLPSLKSHPQADLSAICGRDQERAVERAVQYGIRETYADYRKMVEEADLDAVLIATPDDLHYPMVMAALERGLHVLCEKPLALNATQAAEMLEAAARAQVKNMVYFTYRWFPHQRYYRRLIAEGEIGRPLYFCFRFLQSRDLKADRGSTWHDDATRCSGVLGALGPHLIDACRICVDEIQSVSGSLAAHVPATGPKHPTEPANDSAVLTVETRQGAQGTLHASRVAGVSETGRYLSVHGTQGALELVPTSSGEQIVLMRPGEPPREMPLPDDLAGEFDADKPHRQQLLQVFAEQPVGDRLFIDAILGTASEWPTFYDGYKAQQVVDAAFESQETGRRITILDD